MLSRHPTCVSVCVIRSRYRRINQPVVTRRPPADRFFVPLRVQGQSANRSRERLILERSEDLDALLALLLQSKLDVFVFADELIHLHHQRSI